jgi:hypothetical protein
LNLWQSTKKGGSKRCRKLLLNKNIVSKTMTTEITSRTPWSVDRFNGRGRNTDEHVVRLCRSGDANNADERKRCGLLLEDDKNRATMLIRKSLHSLWREVGSAMVLWAKGELLNVKDLRIVLKGLPEIERLHALYYIFYYYPHVVFPQMNGCTHAEFVERDFLFAEGIEYDSSLASLAAGRKTCFQHLYTTIHNGDRSNLVKQVSKGGKMTLTIKNKERHAVENRARRASVTRFYGKSVQSSAEDGGGLALTEV